MNITKLISELEKELSRHGDVECVVELPESISKNGGLSTIETLIYKPRYEFSKGNERPIMRLDWRT